MVRTLSTGGDGGSDGDGRLRYSRKSPREHVLLRPGMYVGQVEPSVRDTWVYAVGASSLPPSVDRQTLCYSPALLKIFDEILVNAADNRQRGAEMTYIDVRVERNEDAANPLKVS
jgi:DNA topoisomerase-2